MAHVHKIHKKNSLANYKQLNNDDDLSVTNLEDHELVIWFWCPRIDVDAIRQRYDQKFDPLILHYKHPTQYNMQTNCIKTSYSSSQCQSIFAKFKLNLAKISQSINVLCTLRLSAVYDYSKEWPFS